jgi:hypothetical protein
MMRALIVVTGLLLPLPATAGEESITLKEAPGKDVVEANCAACHSLDYIEMNSGFLDRRKWDVTVKKMIDRFGAPIGEADVPAIIDYLTTNYGL